MFLNQSRAVFKYLGKTWTLVTRRIMASMLLFIAVQFVIEGLPKRLSPGLADKATLIEEGKEKWEIKKIIYLEKGRRK